MFHFFLEHFLQHSSRLWQLPCSKPCLSSFKVEKIMSGVTIPLSDANNGVKFLSLIFFPSEKSSVGSKSSSHQAPPSSSTGKVKPFLFSNDDSKSSLLKLLFTVKQNFEMVICFIFQKNVPSQQRRVRVLQVQVKS